MRPVASAVFANSRLTLVLDAVLQSFRPMAAPMLPRIYRVELDDTRGGRHNDGDATGVMDLTTLWTTSSCRENAIKQATIRRSLELRKTECEELGTGLHTPQPQPEWPPPTR